MGIWGRGKGGGGRGPLSRVKLWIRKRNKREKKNTTRTGEKNRKKTSIIWGIIICDEHGGRGKGGRGGVNQVLYGELCLGRIGGLM